jgi:hypothetical protein
VSSPSVRSGIQPYSRQPFSPLYLRGSTFDCKAFNCKVSVNELKNWIRLSEKKVFQNYDLARFFLSIGQVRQTDKRARRSLRQWQRNPLK